MDNVSRVLQRIADIEQRFGCSSKGKVDSGFAAALDKANQVQASSNSSSDNGISAAGQNSGDVSTNSIANLVSDAAKKYGVDPKLALAIAKTESGFSPDAVSSAGAVGVMQLMPDTATAIGVRNIHNTQENVEGGVRYLRQMLDTFQGNKVYAAAAYNAGPQAVKDYNGVPPFTETQNYVKNVLSLCG